MTNKEIKNKAKETSGGNYYYEQGFIYGFELGEENGRKEVTYMKAEEYDKYLNACRENEILKKEYAELKAEKQQIQEQIKKILLVDENAETGDIRKLIGMDWYDVKEIEQLKYNLKCREDELAESKAQIEKMKCCGNCKYAVYSDGICIDCGYDERVKPLGRCKNGSNWELAE